MRSGLFRDRVTSTRIICIACASVSLKVQNGYWCIGCTVDMETSTPPPPHTHTYTYTTHIKLRATPIFQSTFLKLLWIHLKRSAIYCVMSYWDTPHMTLHEHHIGLADTAFTWLRLWPWPKQQLFIPKKEKKRKKGFDEHSGHNKFVWKKLDSAKARHVYC
jgi:hypothetical protein